MVYWPATLTCRETSTIQEATRFFSRRSVVTDIVSRALGGLAKIWRRWCANLHTSNTIQSVGENLIRRKTKATLVDSLPRCGERVWLWYRMSRSWSSQPFNRRPSMGMTPTCGYLSAQNKGYPSHTCGILSRMMGGIAWLSGYLNYIMLLLPRRSISRCSICLPCILWHTLQFGPKIGSKNKPHLGRHKQWCDGMTRTCLFQNLSQHVYSW